MINGFLPGYSVKKSAFPAGKFQMLLHQVLAEKWYIPVEQGEPLGICLTAAISLAQTGKNSTMKS